MLSKAQLINFLRRQPLTILADEVRSHSFIIDWWVVNNNESTNTVKRHFSGQKTQISFNATIRNPSEQSAQFVCSATLQILSPLIFPTIKTTIVKRKIYCRLIFLTGSNHPKHPSRFRIWQQPRERARFMMLHRRSYNPETIWMNDDDDLVIKFKRIAASVC